MKLSNNFALREFTESNTALRRGIDNNPTAEHIHNLAELVENILQPLRDKIGQSIRVTSGYRCAELNSAIGGASRNGKPTSDHCYGRAADIKLVVDGVNKSELLYHTIKNMAVPFKQLIWEFGDEDTPQWVHIAFDKDNNKGQCLQAYKEGEKTRYREI